MRQFLLKIAIALISLLMSIFPAEGQETNEGTLLYEIKGNGLEQPSYLFGTIHLLCPDDLNLSKKVITAMDNSDQLVLEIDLSDRNVLKEIQAKMMYTDGTTASDYLNENELKTVERFFKDSLKMPFERLKNIKPFFLTSMTYRHYLDCQPASWEFRLVQEAKKRDMEIAGLETAEEQMAAIESLPLPLRKNMLLESISDFQNMKTLFDEMLSYYLNENILKIHSLANEYMSDEYAEMESKLLSERNHNWIEQINEVSKTQSAFYAVGAAHLGGANGVIKLLQNQGYQVTPIY